MKLFIDIGNQRVKWATSDQIDSPGNLATSSQVFSNQILGNNLTGCADQLKERFMKLAVPDSIWISSVSEENAKLVVSGICEAIWNVSPRYARSTMASTGMMNGYDDPVSLGVDRWMAMIGARKIVGLYPIVVIDAGTAVTVDFVNIEGCFLGGIIFPGVSMMINSVNSSTGQIRGISQPGNWDDIVLTNTNTQAAVENGVLLSVVSTIDAAVDRLQSAQTGKLRLVITGGDAVGVMSLSRHKMRIEPNLVLIGLSCISGESMR